MGNKKWKELGNSLSVNAEFSDRMESKLDDLIANATNDYWKKEFTNLSNFYKT